MSQKFIDLRQMRTGLAAVTTTVSRTQAEIKAEIKTEIKNELKALKRFRESRTTRRDSLPLLSYSVGRTLQRTSPPPVSSVRCLFGRIQEA